MLVLLCIKTLTLSYYHCVVWNKFVTAKNSYGILWILLVVVFLRKYFYYLKIKFVLLFCLYISVHFELCFTDFKDVWIFNSYWVKYFIFKYILYKWFIMLIIVISFKLACCTNCSVQASLLINLILFLSCNKINTSIYN